MPIVTEDTKENIRAANDIVDVIGRYVSVKRAGGTFKALCPFHKEKTPSFVINQKRQSYHCFGCGVGGDVFRFVMDYEGVDFPTAMKMLADRVGITIRMSDENPQKQSDKETIYKIHEELAGFYNKVLLSHKSGREALEYLTERDMADEIIATFKLGYAPATNTMRKWGEKNGFSSNQLIKAGVLVEKESGHYDRFRGRIMFPICDTMGRVIGFSGRILREDQSPAKYLNSPETLLFKKSRVLYGLHRARKPMIDAGWALVCEGQIDCIRCQMNGFENAIAPQGTALTSEQARILKRQVDSVVLLFDPDEAGQKAAIRSAEIMLAEGLAVNVAELPQGSDPDSLLRKEGEAALRKIVENARSAVLYQIDTLARKEDLNTNTGMLRVCRAALQMTRACESAVQRDRMIQEISTRLNISESALARDLASLKTPKSTSAPPPKKKESARYPPEELDALRYLYNTHELCHLARQFLPASCFTAQPCRNVFEAILETERTKDCGLSAQLSESDPETAKLAAKLDAVPPPQTDKDYDPEDAFKHIIVRLRFKNFKRQRDAYKAKANKSPTEIEHQAKLTHWMSSMKSFMHSKDWEKAEILLKTIS